MTSDELATGFVFVLRATPVSAALSLPLRGWSDTFAQMTLRLFHLSNLLRFCGEGLVTGFLIDRVFAPYITAGVFSLVACGCLALGLGGIEYALVAAIALGLAMGAEVDLIGYFTARYFGLRNYGVLFGIQYSAFSLGCGISPLLAGQIWDLTGNYDYALIGAAVLLMLAVLISLSLPKFPALQELDVD